MVRKFIQERIRDVGLTPAEVSRRLGMNVTYIQQYLKKGSPREIPERLRHALAELLNVPEDQLRGSSAPLPTKSYARNMTTQQSNVDQSLTRGLTKVSGGPSGTPVTEALFGAFDLPVYGMVHGAGGELIISNRAVDWVARPFFLTRVEDAYALIVVTESMAPALRTGAIALINPHLPPRAGDMCLFRSRAEGSDKILIKEYRGESDTVWKTRKLHPEASVILKKSEWQTCHRIVGSYFP